MKIARRCAWSLLALPLCAGTLSAQRAYEEPAALVRAAGGWSHGRVGGIAPSYGPHRVWVPGHYEVVEERVWIPMRRHERWVEPTYELRRDSCGRLVRVCVRSGRFELVCEPGHYELRRARVWRPGHWSTDIGPGPSCGAGAGCGIRVGTARIG